MGRYSSPLPDAVLELARKSKGRFVSTAEAVRALLPDTGGTPEARRSVYHAVYVLRNRGELRCERGRFALADQSEPEALPVKRPPMGADVHSRINRVVLALNEAHEEISELRHALGVAERYEDARPSLPMRCAEPWEQD